MNMKKFYVISFFIILIIITGFLSLEPKAQALSIAVSGTATITNTGYLIYFNSTDSGILGGTSGNISYSVQYDPSTGFSGYAWSSEYGWIQFISGSPSAQASSFVGANDTETPTDWATGAISLSGTNGGTFGNIPYNVTFNPMTGNVINHWAWGGNVIGWVDFSNVKIVPAESTLLIKANNTYPILAIDSGTSVTLSWSGSGIQINSCDASGGWTGTGKNVVGSQSLGALASSANYTITCNKLSGGIISSTVSIVVGCSTTDYSTEGSSCYCSLPDNAGGPNCSNDCVSNPTYPLCCIANPPTLPADKITCRKVPHYIEH